MNKKVYCFFILIFMNYVFVFSYSLAKTNNSKKTVITKKNIVKKEEKNKNKNKEKKNNSEEIIKEEMIPLSLAHLLDLALRRNDSLKSSYLNVDMADSDVKIQKSSLYPSLSAGGSYNMNEDFTNKSNTNTKNATLNAKYTVFAFGKTTDKIKEVQYRLNAIKYQNNKDIQDLIYNISTLYYKMLLLISQKSALIEVEKNSSQILEIVNLKYKLGIVVLNDTLKAKTNNDLDKLSILKIDNQINASKSEINKVLNLDINYELFIKESDDFTVKKTTKTFEELLEIAVNNRNELKIKFEEKKIYQKQLDSIKKEFLPVIDAGARVGKQDSRVKKGNNTPVNSTDDYGEISLSVTIPLFNGFSTTNQVKKINASIKQNDIDINNTKNIISKEVFDSYNDLLTYEESYFITERILKSSKESAKLALGMYKNGKTTIADLMTSNANLKNSKHDYLNNKYLWLMAKMNLLRKIGKINIENINNITEF